MKKIVWGFLLIYIGFCLFCLLTKPTNVDFPPIMPMYGMELALLISWFFGIFCILEGCNPEVHNDFDGFGSIVVAGLFASIFTLPIVLMNIIWVFVWSKQ